MTAYRMSQYMVVHGGYGSFEALPSFLRIGFGRYQWQLFILSGLGWMADSKNEYSFASSPSRSHPIKTYGCKALPLYSLKFSRSFCLSVPSSLLSLSTLALFLALRRGEVWLTLLVDESLSTLVFFVRQVPYLPSHVSVTVIHGY